jgi:putative ATP-dependent endonuclease of the OLD family
MRLTAVHTKNFRSITDANLEGCGDLNVLIGKNNSGKSNLLSAIESFFSFFANGSVIATPRTPLRNATDWYGQNVNNTVSIKAMLDLNEDESALVRQAISDEVPQMKNALDEIYATSSRKKLECELTFLNAPTPVAYVKNISFGAPDEEHLHLIIGLGIEAANEIASRENEILNLSTQKRALASAASQMDYSDWRIVKEQGARYILRRTDPSLASDPEINRIVTSSSSLEEFRERVRLFNVEIQNRITELTSATNKSRVDTFSGQSDRIPGYVTTIIALISKLKVHHLSERRSIIGEPEARRILNLKMSRGQGNALKDIQDTVSTLLGVKIDAFSSEQQVRSAEISAELDVDDFLVQVNGSGIREALRVVLDYEFERPDVLLVEEPEVHLHPALETAMMQYLRKVSLTCQVFLTTHSTNFLDIADLKNVYLITKDESTHVQLLDAEEAEEAIPQELGIRLSSLFLYDRLVFVEGPSDEQTLLVFAATLGIILSQAGVGFITTGGARNYSYYSSANTLGFLAKRRVKLYFVIDRDERDLPEIEKLERQLGNLGELRVLNRRELENYLIVPDALMTYINNRAGKSLVDSPEQIEVLVQEACAELFDTTLERRVLRMACAPVIPDRQAVIDRQSETAFISALEAELDKAEQRLAKARANISEWLTTARDQFKDADLQEQLKIIPGDEILDFVFQKFGMRFHKRKDGPRLAALIRPEAIDGEIKNLLNAIAASD